MNVGSPLQQDVGGCPDGTVRTEERLSSQAPFRFVTACLEKTGRKRMNRWSILFITDSSIILTPVPEAILCADPTESGSADEPKPTQTAMRQWFHRDSDSVILERLDNLVRQCHDTHSDRVFGMEHDADAIPLETIKEIIITRVRSSGRYSRLLSVFSLYPAEPANARYHVNFQLVVTTGKMKLTIITPFSFELKQALRDLLGDRVHEIPDEYAPLL